MKMMKQNKRIAQAMPLLALLIPCVIGSIAMLCNQLPAVTCALNIGAVIVFGGLAIGLSRIKGKPSSVLLLAIGIGLLLLTFAEKGAENVHRWINLGGVSLHASMLAVPCCLAALQALLTKQQSTFAYSGMLCIGSILFLQPDASQLTGFTLGCAVLLFAQKSHSWVDYFTLLCLMILSVLSFFRLDQLEAVAHVEGILQLVKEIHPLLMGIGIVSLIVVPIPFLFLSKGHMRTVSLAYGLYFEAMIVFSAFGHFPVPMMGFGVSPIVGFCMLYAWLLREPAIGE
ncbi:MAG: hypothetical protein RR379_05950 [Clostridia bacterium]